MNQLTKTAKPLESKSAETSEPKLIIRASSSSKKIYWEYKSADGKVLSNSSVKVLKIDNLAIRSINSGTSILITNITCIIDYLECELPEFDYDKLSLFPESVDFLRRIVEKAGCKLDLQLVA